MSFLSFALFSFGCLLAADAVRPEENETEVELVDSQQANQLTEVELVDSQQANQLSPGRESTSVRVVSSGVAKGLKEMKAKLDEIRHNIKNQPKNLEENVAGDFAEEFLVGNAIGAADAVVPGASIALNIIWGGKELIPTEEQEKEVAVDMTWCMLELKHKQMYLSVVKVGQTGSGIVVGICLSPVVGAAYGAATNLLLNWQEKKQLQDLANCGDAAKKVKEEIDKAQEEFSQNYEEQSKAKLLKALAELGGKERQAFSEVLKGDGSFADLKPEGNVPDELSFANLDKHAVARKF